MTKYFIANGEQSKGPFPLNELLNNGLTPDAQVKADGQDSWVRAAEMPEVAALFAAPCQSQQAPPPPPQVSSIPQPPEPMQTAGIVPPRPQVAAEPQPVYEAGVMTEFYESIRICFANYANFKGRARRSEFWWFVLFVVVLTSLTMGLGFFAVAVPLAAVSVRRLHDITQQPTKKINTSFLSQFFNYSEWSVAFYFLIFVVVAVLFYVFYVFYSPSFAEASVFKVLAYLLLVVTIIMVALYCIDSDKKANIHGLSPKYFLSTDEMAVVPGRPRMGFLTSVVTCYKKYFNYRDRARRSELWWFVLFCAILTMIIFSIRPFHVYFGNINFHIGSIDITYNRVFFIVTVFMPLMAAVVRRLHDTNHGGIWVAIHFSFLLFAIVINEIYTHVIEMSFSKWSNGFLYIYKLKGRNIFMELYGWGLMIAALAFLVAIIVMCCLDSDKVPNEYEGSPKYGPEEQDEDEF